MTVLADLPGAAEWALVYQRFTDALTSGGLAAQGEPLAADLSRYLSAASQALGLPPPRESAHAGRGTLRTLCDPWLQAAESSYQQWARSAVARDAWRAATSLQTVPSVNPSAMAALAQTAHAWASAGDLPDDGLSPSTVYTDGHVRLLRYAGSTAVTGAPLLILYAFVNRPSILDLEPDRSFIRGLIEGGRDVYLLDWGPPDPASAERGIAALIDEVIDRAVRTVGGRRKVDLLGICQGGVFSLLYAAMHPQRIRRLVTVVTPVDFQTPDDLLSHWVRGIDTTSFENVESIPGSLLDLAFQWLAPYRLGVGKFVDLLDHAHDPEWVLRFRRMERWVHDCPDQPKRIFSEFLRKFYQENGFVNRSLELGEERVDLRHIRVPLLNVYGLHDHIVPPAASRALATQTSSTRYEEIAVPTGHIGVFVSTRARGLPRQITSWLARR